MKRIFFLLLLAISWQSPARGIIDFKISKPVCLLTFLQTASGGPDMSGSLKTYIGRNVQPGDAAEFARIVGNFSKIALGYSYTIPSYPESRQWPRTTENLIYIAAVQATDVSDFFQRIIGILPNEDWLQLKNAMEEAEPIYDKMIAGPYGESINQQLAELRKFDGSSDGIFNKLKNFYGSTWNIDIPFTISIYPIPGKKGSIIATPHSNSIVLAVMTEETNHAQCVSQALHEMCHVLYLEQRLSLQEKIDNYFAKNTSKYAQYAYGYFDEAVATACGNAWAYKVLSGSALEGSWYDDEYINGYAHAIYPLTEEYLESGKQIDRAFVDKAIYLFEKTFPGAIYNYGNLINNVNIYTDAKDHGQFVSVISSVKKYFEMHKSSSGYPIADPQGADAMDQAKGTQFFIVYTNHDKNYQFLRNKFPLLNQFSSGKEGVISFFDDKKRPVIILNVKRYSAVRCRTCRDGRT